MQQKVKYVIKGQPTTLRKVSDAVVGMAIVLFVFVDFLYTPLSYLPLELQVFAIGELIPKIFLELNALVILLFCIGMGVYAFKWRLGLVSLADGQITLNGDIRVSILIEKIEAINFFDSEMRVGNKRIVQIKTITDLFKIKFLTSEDFEDFAERLVLIAGTNENIKISTSVVESPQNQ